MITVRGITAVTLLLAPCVCLAQTVRGVVVDPRSQPLPGVVVVLVDVRDSTVARALTNSSGEFRLVAPVSGSYRVSTLRIGFRPTTTEAFALRSDEEAIRRLAITEVPSSLDTIRVRGRNACKVRPDSALATFAIWEQARAALVATQLSAANEAVATRVIVYRRVLDPERGQVLRQEVAVSSSRDARIWRSLASDSLRATGYIQTDPRGGVSFYAPDLDVLLSDAFVEDHCFRLDDRLDAVRVGIAFEPTGERRRIPEIRGTLWVDRKSSELRSMDFTYTNVARDLEAAEPGGAIRFARLRDGSWAITSWNIRMPLVQTRRMEGSRSLRQRGVQTQVSEVHVTGGDLAMVSRGRDTLWSQPPMVLRGRIVDSVTSAGVAGAWLTLPGTRLSGLTDSEGFFAIQGALPGEYTVDIRTPSLDSVGASHRVAVNFADSAGSIVLATPTASNVVAGMCPVSGDGRGTLFGTVMHRGDSLPRANARVIADWTDRTAADGRVERRREARSSADGRFRLCGLPTDFGMTLRAEDDSAKADSMTVRVAGNRAFTVIDLWLAKSANQTATLEGAVLSDVNAQPIADVEVAVPGLAKNTFTDARGAFRIAGVTPGTHAVIVRRLGFRQVGASIEFPARATVRREFVLSRLVVLDTIAVKASLRDQIMREFEDNRRLGLGKFWTRADLAKLEGFTMAAILSQVSGSRVARGRSNYAWITRSRGVQTLGGTDGTVITPDRFDMNRGAGRACYSTVWVDGVRVYSGKAEEPLFNVNSITPDMIEAMEYYVGPAQTPARYAGLNTNCGVLVIWTRRAR